MSEQNQPNSNEPPGTPASLPALPALSPQTPTPKKFRRRTLLFLGIGVGIVVLLGGAAYAAGTLMGGPVTMHGGNSGFTVSLGSGGPGQMMFKAPPVKNAPQIPTAAPDVRGLYLRRQDQSIFIGTGKVQIMFTKDASGQAQSSATNDGPEVEVVVNHDTSIYVDKTPFTQEILQSGQEVQQVVEPIASLDDLTAQLGKTDTLSAWGEKAGSRIIAKVLLYQPPMLMPGGGGK